MYIKQSLLGSPSVNRMVHTNCVCVDVSSKHSRRIVGKLYKLRVCSLNNALITFLGGYPLTLRYDDSLLSPGSPIAMCHTCYLRNKQQWEKVPTLRCFSEGTRIDLLSNHGEMDLLLSSSLPLSPLLPASYVRAKSPPRSPMLNLPTAIQMIEANQSPKSDVKRAVRRLTTDSPVKVGQHSVVMRIPVARGTNEVKKKQLQRRLNVLQTVERLMTSTTTVSTMSTTTTTIKVSTGDTATALTTPAAAQLGHACLKVKGAVVLGAPLTPEAGLGLVASIGGGVRALKELRRSHSIISKLLPVANEAQAKINEMKIDSELLITGEDGCGVADHGHSAFS